MSLVELAALYALVGVGCAAARWHRDRRAWLDAALLVPFWPLLVPFLLTPPAPAVRPDAGFLAALARAARTPLGALLPAPGSIRRLAARLALASERVDDIDRLLVRAEFDLGAAERHLDTLRARGASACALGSAGLRVQNIRRLVELRARFARELEDVRELLAQLATQVEVVRLSGAADASSAELLHELCARVEGLDAVLAQDPDAAREGGLAERPAAGAH